MNASYEIILPNYLIHLNEGVRSLEMGRIRAALTEDVAADLSKRGLPLTITVGPELSEGIRDKNLALTMPGSCRVVKLAAAKDNANEEAKWLIDVALNFLRMSYKLVGPMFLMADNPALPGRRAI